MLNNRYNRPYEYKIADRKHHMNIKYQMKTIPRMLNIRPKNENIDILFDVFLVYIH